MEAKRVHLLITNVHLRRFGIADLQTNNGAKVKAQWVLMDTPGVVIEGTDIVYTSTAKNTRDQAEALARKWLAKNPQYTEGK